MIDETFHLTPLDVRRYEFGRAIRGYDPERVDQFREQVAQELERLARVNQELEAKAKGFHEQLRAFRDRDKAINEALVSAQQLRGDIREQAEKEGALIVREARGEAERMIEEARGEIRRMEEQLTALERTRRTYLAHVRAVLERQLSELNAVESAQTPEGRDGAGTPSWMGSLVKE
jgi:DivIVA domain-containing protein